MLETRDHDHIDPAATSLSQLSFPGPSHPWLVILPTLIPPPSSNLSPSPGHLTWPVDSGGQTPRKYYPIIATPLRTDTEHNPAQSYSDTQQRESRRKPLHSKFPTLIIGNKLFGWSGEVFFLSEPAVALSNYPGDITNIFTAT